MRPITKLEIRDLNLEVEERLAKLKPLQALAIVRGYKRGTCYGMGLSLESDLILRNFVRLLGAEFSARPPAATNRQFTMYDVDGVERTFRLYYATTAETFYGNLGGSELAFGNPATTPTPARTNVEIANLVARFAPSSVVVNETNWWVTQTGSYVWTAGGTVRCAGMSLYLIDGTSTYRTVLMYYDSVADVGVPAGGTVSVTYTTQL